MNIDLPRLHPLRMVLNALGWTLLTWIAVTPTALGITAIRDAHVDLDGRREYRPIPAWWKLRVAGDLKMRTSLAWFWKTGAGKQVNTT